MRPCFTTETSSFRIISPTLYAAWIITGLAPKEGEREVSSWPNPQWCRGMTIALCPTVWFLIITLLTAILSYTQDNWNVREWELAMVVYMLQKWMGKANLLLTYGICTTTGLRHLRIFTRALRFADTFLRRNDQESWKKTLGGIVFVTHCLVTTSILVVARKGYHEMYSRLILVVVVFFKTMVTLQFVYLVLELRERFRSVNACLRELMPPLQAPELRAVFGEGLREVASQSVPERLRQLREAYLVLTHAVETLLRHFGLPLALNIARCVGGATFYAYGMLSPAGTQQSPYQWANISALWLVHLSTLLVVLSLACATAADQANETGALLLKASTVCNWNSPELDAFMRLTLQGPQLRLTAAGLVVVDRGLLVSALAVVVTYLVVLGQQ